MNSYKNKKLMAEINVTPFIDVMLVLLIIFMITTPLMLNAIRMDLPKTKENNAHGSKGEEVVLSVTAEEKIFIDNREIKLEDLIKVLREKLKSTGTDRIFLRADYQLNYGMIAGLISIIKQGGISSISLVTEIEIKK